MLMRNIQLVSLKPGVGASTFAFCLARELRAELVIDSPNDVGALLAAGITRRDWPQIVDSPSAPANYVAEKADQLMAMLPTIDEMTIAGGDKTPSGLQDCFMYWAEKYQLISLQPIDSTATKVFILDYKDEFDEQLAALEDFVVGSQPFAVIAKTSYFKSLNAKTHAVLAGVPVFQFRFQTAVSSSLRMGFGIPAAASMSKTSGIVAGWLQDMWIEESQVINGA
jgi:hypothetical protein